MDDDVAPALQGQSRRRRRHVDDDVTPALQGQSRRRRHMEGDDAPALQRQSRRRHMEDDDAPEPQGYYPRIVPGRTPLVASRFPWTWTASSEAAAAAAAGHLHSSKRARVDGTSEEAILGLLQEVTGGSHEGEECAVCLQDFRAEKTLMAMPCSHTFHRHCISKWLRRNAVCPLCRHQLLPTATHEEAGGRVVYWEEDAGVVYGVVEEEDGSRRGFNLFSAFL